MPLCAVADTIMLPITVPYYLTHPRALPLAARQEFFTYERIRLGMSSSEVEAVIGVPPGDYDTKHAELAPSMCPHGIYVRKHGLASECLPEGGDYTKKLTVKHWTWNDYWIRVAFDESDAVVGCYLLEADDRYRQNQPSSILDLVQGWFRD